MTHYPECSCAKCERAAIYQYDAGMTRAAAEMKAGIGIQPASGERPANVRPTCGDPLTAHVIAVFDGALCDLTAMNTEIFSWSAAR